MYEGFEYYTPTKVIFGAGAEKKVAEQIKTFGGTKVLVHYGGQSAVKSGLIDRVKGYLDDAGIAHVELGGVVPNPHLDKVYEGIDLCQSEGVDFILAVGGGSVIDSSKAIGYGLTNDCDVWDFYSGKARAKACLPLASILTISAAGSEMSSSSVITNEKTGEKRGYGSDVCRPRFAIMDPALTLTLPEYQTMSGATDILMHTMERYFNQSDNMEITDALSEALMRTVIKAAKVLIDDPSDIKARSDVMWAGSLSHNGLTGCGTGGGDWATHNIEHELGGMFDVTHGAGLAALWGTWARYVHHAAPHRFVKFAVNVLGVTEGPDDGATIEAGIQAMEDFYREIHMPTNLRELGVDPTDEEIEKMADSCTRGDKFKVGSVVPLTKDDIIEIYKEAK